MSSENPIIMLLEDCPTTAMAIEHAVLHELPKCRLLWARTVREARKRSAGLPVSVFIVDIILPDGSGLEFLEHATVAHPSAAALVITSAPLPAYRALSAALGVLNFLEKPLDLPAFIGHVRNALGAHGATVASRDFRATLENVTPLDILQLKCLSGASTVIEFRAHTDTGRVRLCKGEVVDARTNACVGVDAVREILSWPHGRVQEFAADPDFEQTIFSSWQSLLMEVAQAMDEGAGRSVLA